MGIREFIRRNRATLDHHINEAMSRPNNRGEFIDHTHESHNDEERRQWILNDEGLYNWARSEGVRI